MGSGNSSNRKEIPGAHLLSLMSHGFKSSSPTYENGVKRIPLPSGVKRIPLPRDKSPPENYSQSVKLKQKLRYVRGIQQRGGSQNRDVMKIVKNSQSDIGEQFLEQIENTDHEIMKDKILFELDIYEYCYERSQQIIRLDSIGCSPLIEFSKLMSSIDWYIFKFIYDLSSLDDITIYCMDITTYNRMQSLIIQYIENIKPLLESIRYDQENRKFFYFKNESEIKFIDIRQIREKIKRRVNSIVQSHLTHQFLGQDQLKLQQFQLPSHLQPKSQTQQKSQQKS